MSRLAVPLRGSLEATGDLFEPFRLADPAGRAVGPAAAYLREVAASGRAAATQRSYGMDLLRWFRFLWAVEVPWDQATRAEARDFLCWIQLADKPSRPHWRYPGGGAPGRGGKRQAPGSPNPVTGKPSRGRGYAAATVAHCETVLRGFYDFHLEAGTGPMVNPFPLARGRRGDHAALRGSAERVMIFPVFQVPGLQHVTDQPEKPVIADLLRQYPEQDIVVNTAEAVGDVSLDEPHGPGPGLLDFPQRGMAAAPFPEPVRPAGKLRLVIRLQQEPHHLADQLI